MTAVSKATATWQGDLIHGGGKVRPESEAFEELPVSWVHRAERSKAHTSPEELLAAAHAACYCMALSNAMGKENLEHIRLEASAEVTFVPGTGVTDSLLTVRGAADGLTAGKFKELAEAAKEGCPISGALKGNVQITLDAALFGD
jgi:osmotically inducible protein OsmC